MDLSDEAPLRNLRCDFHPTFVNTSSDKRTRGGINMENLSACDIRWTVRLGSSRDLIFVKRIVSLLGKLNDQSAGAVILRALTDLAIDRMGTTLGTALVKSYLDPPGFETAR